jgi:hypothetical protein
MGGAHPEDDLSLRHDRLDDWGGIGIPTVRQRDVPRPQGKVAEAFAGMVIREENSDKLSLHQVHTDVQAILGALRPRALYMTAIDDQEAPGCWECGDRLGMQHLR